MIKDNLKVNFCNKCNYPLDHRIPECPKCGAVFDEKFQKLCRNPLIYIDSSKIFILLGVLLAISFLIPGIVSIIASSIDPLIVNNAVYNLSLLLATHLLGIIFAFILLNKYLKFILRELKDWRTYVFPLLMGFIVVSLSLLYNYLVFDLGGVTINSNENLVEAFIKDSPILAAFPVIIFGPLYEEILYRLTLIGIGNKIDKEWGYILSVIIFVLVHLNIPTSVEGILPEIAAIPAYLISANLLAIAYYRYGLVGSYIVHLVNNGIMFILVFVL